MLGIGIGVVQAMRGGALDTALSIVSVTLFALPGYWLGLMLVMVFTYRARCAAGVRRGRVSTPTSSPAGRAWPTGCDIWRCRSPRSRSSALGGTARYVRGAMLDVVGAPFVAIARAKGMTPTRVALRHVLRNALIPVLTLLGLSLPALFSGAVFIEAIFAWPGVGRVLVEAVQARDYPVVMAATAVSAVLVVLGNLLAELLTAWADPRLREAAR